MPAMVAEGLLGVTMPMLTAEQARTFAEEWLEAWNRHDLDKVLSHYADPPEHSSPLVAERLQRADGCIRNVGQLRAYFAAGLAAIPPLRFDLLDVFTGVASVALLYRNQRGQTVLEVMWLDDDAKVLRSTVHHQ